MADFSSTILNFYRRVFARRVFYPFNKALYFMALRGIGVDNWEDPQISGELDFLRRFGRAVSSPTVLDVGANVGQYAKLVLQTMPKAKIYSFEPHPESFKTLSRLAEQQGFKAHHVALSDERGNARLFDHKGEPGGSQHATLFRDVIEVAYQEESESWPVDVTTLDAFVQEENIDHIDLLKIDVEGAELKVLVGARATLAKGGIDVIQFEYTAANVVTHLFMKDYVDLLEGYSFYRMLPDGLVPLLSYNAAVFEICAYQNIVAVREGTGVQL